METKGSVDVEGKVGGSTEVVIGNGSVLELAKHVRGKDGEFEKQKEEHAIAGEQAEAGSVVDASGSPSDLVEEKSSKRKRANESTGNTNMVSAGSKKSRVDTVETAPDQTNQKSTSRRSVRSVAQQEKKASPQNSAAKTGKSRSPSNNNAKRSPGPRELEDMEMGTIEEYRALRIRLEKIRHRRIYDGEKRLLYAHKLVKLNYDHEVRLADIEYENARRLLMQRLMQENMEHQRRVEELRYKIIRDDPHGVYPRKHEMSLRGRGAKDAGAHGAHDSSIIAGSHSTIIENDSGYTDQTHQDRGSRNRRRVSIDRARVRVELETGEVMDDLAEVFGDRRPGGEGTGKEDMSRSSEGRTARAAHARTTTRSRRGEDNSSSK
uniref:Uncharacterized protein n=1 Tax=Rhodosorus marinus TaxID=101924 RepID=A0A7S2ZSR3_9RHOD|mmetsp:Transcript_31416/g.121558  ORF Transcript_31416/g.121558 Transcript_31416/m.121558 type:complete len:378 (+) Transcript_31416:92-1225(+)|eukprot:CAMPEP_0113961822 /NCGR_PEP_ID=MMETSP0011_2-20120614/5548_1 /TAXON_ID=101924 /ORGANISM="Rhodosorus marinus" /LENGTH=377 /DNA_ID=CAMNT_0000973557 /DNA_START=49 /DNA_END=1182 /DNA_ORIENTATION=+ /assembly_acc=CAM_ASM_000156